ncbi:MAG: SGNH/GDSL hydrolase family protein [Clostridia bacterium]|nr:SGNH/GDSL hydrolase family protein [Clostridia bacterium]
MKKIILLGDSIRMGYDKYVKDALEGVAEVYYPEENCKFAQYLLRFMNQWKNDGKWPADADLVHWNAGLWDVVELFGEPPITTEGQYAEMISRTDRLIRRLFPNAKVVFATSTSVQEEKYRPDFKRRNEIIKRYNDIAIEALAGRDCTVNRLFDFTLALPESCRSDMTHFNTPEGRRAMGDRVLSVICGELGIDAGEVKLESFVPENYSAKNIGN